VYIWKTKNLISDLKEGKVSEKEKLKYVIFLGVAYAVLSDPAISIGIEYSAMDAINLVLVVVLTVFGIIYAYKMNCKGDNTDFITRYTCLSIPIGTKIFCLALVAGILVGILDIAFMSEGIESIDESLAMPTSLTQVVVTALIMVLFYYYLGKGIYEVSVNDAMHNNANQH